MRFGGGGVVCVFFAKPSNSLGASNPSKVGSSSIGARLRRISPYVSDKNASVAVSSNLSPISARSNVKVHSVPSVLHASKVYPSGVQHKSTTDCEKHLRTMHTGFGLFVVQMVSLQSCEPQAMTVCNF